MGMGSALDAYDFALPTEQIAQTPLQVRDASRLMVLRRGQPGWRHGRFSALPELLPPRSVLVFNNTRVIPARLTGERPGGRPLEALLVEEQEPGRWQAMVRPARRLRPGDIVRFAAGTLTARCVQRTPEGYWLLEFEHPETFRERLERAGLTPLPPYLRRSARSAEQERRDREDYQTVYASRPGAVAAPTAGLHFTPELLGRLDAAGFTRLEVTLHVGPGTFARVQVDDPAQHHMHAERFEIAAPVAERLLRAKEAGEPIVAVGTTAVRSLETWALRGYPRGCVGTTDLFIHPPFAFQATDGLLTNFHLPRSTLLMLVAAFHGRERVLEAYGAAVAYGYRFFSFGDAMLILPAGFP
jgi:S-adenosylmethionine:tRNA ribosyltransferase-isomerase